MLGASLCFHGVELLRRLENLEAAATKGATAGIPLLYPWANRLESLSYQSAGKSVQLPANSSKLHFDDRGLAIHGIPWALLGWDVIETTSDSIFAQLQWNQGDRLAIFPFAHQLEMRATLRPDNLLIETAVLARDRPVPVSFGFHPYFGLPNTPRAEWRLRLPRMRRLQLNANGIPTGTEEPFVGFDSLLGESAFDDGFALTDKEAAFALSGGGLSINVELLQGYGFAQIFAPIAKDFVALEPMTAATNALISGRGLNVVEPGNQYRASFRILVESIA